MVKIPQKYLKWAFVVLVFLIAVLFTADGFEDAVVEWLIAHILSFVLFSFFSCIGWIVLSLIAIPIVIVKKSNGFTIVGRILAVLTVSDGLVIWHSFAHPQGEDYLGYGAAALFLYFLGATALCFLLGKLLRRSRKV